MLCKDHEVVIIIANCKPVTTTGQEIDVLYQKVDNINDLKGTLVLEFDCII